MRTAKAHQDGESAMDRMKRLVEKRVRIKKRMAAEKKRKKKTTTKTEKAIAKEPIDMAVKRDTAENNRKQMARADREYYANK